MTKLTQAILAVMQEVKSIDKNLNVGSGNGQYKGVADKDVKQAIGTSMGKHGLVMIPISIEPHTSMSEWEETTQNGNRHRSSVFTEVKTKYMLMHESGEGIEICGYGHGVDSQDKSAGKATTYALKNALLYTFLVPTGDIDDTDNTHSDDLPAIKKQVQKEEPGLTATCPIHNVVMKHHENARGEWWSHRLSDGSYCTGKSPKKATQPKQEEEYDYSQVMEDINF